QPPEQIAVLVGARPYVVAGSGDHLCSNQVVGGETVLAHEPSEPTSERQTCDAGRRDHPSGRGEAMELGLAIELAPRHAGPGSHRAAPGIDVDALHEGEVEHQAAVADGLPRHAVTAAADGKLQVACARESHGTDHID